MRLIDADNLKIPSDAPYKASVKRVVAQQPTVEAKEVVHGKWIEHEEDAKGNSPVECPRCRYLYARLYPKNCCPNCGADMRTSAE